MGLDWDEGPEADGDHGPYFQTQRAETYSAALEHLREAGAAYPCFCTVEELEAKRAAAREQGGYAGYDRTCRRIPAEEARERTGAGEPHVWRLAVPEGRGDVVFPDAIRGEVTFSAEVLDDFVLVRSEGSPTYNFATVVDDQLMGITHVIRGDDHLSNTPRQILVFEALGAPVPTFAHLSMILGADGKRLSKRHGATSVEAYRDMGVLPEALLNHLSLLGWSLDAETTLFTREELVENFGLDRVSKNPAIFDPDKLEWMNGVYLREMPPEEYVDRMIPWLAGAGLIAAEEAPARRGWLLGVAELVRERVKLLEELAPMVRYLFVDAVEIDEQAREKVLRADGADRALEAAAARLRALPCFETGDIEATLREIPEEIGAKPKLVFQAVRVAVTGSTVSPPLFESLELLGKERALERIEAALSEAGK
jgi:glutamyl-tRNA synthetase